MQRLFSSSPRASCIESDLTRQRILTHHRKEFRQALGDRKREHAVPPPLIQLQFSATVNRRGIARLMDGSGPNLRKPPASFGFGGWAASRFPQRQRMKKRCSGTDRGQVSVWCASPGFARRRARTTSTSATGRFQFQFEASIVSGYVAQTTRATTSGAASSALRNYWRVSTARVNQRIPPRRRSPRSRVWFNPDS